VTNEDIAQQWVEKLPVIRRYLDITRDDLIWQEDPQRVLDATNRITGLKQWCLKVMETMPEMREKFLEDIEQRGGNGDSCDFTFAVIRQVQMR